MPLSSKKLGRLELLEEIQAGVSGELFRARDTRNGQEVGVHILPFSRGAPVQFEGRHHRVAQLKSHNILGVRGLRGKTDISYIVTDPVAGEPLASILRRGPIATPEAVDFADQIVRALETAHAGNVVHGDLSPEHVLVDESGNLKVFGFSLARQGPLEEDEVNEYLSPEAVRGRPIDARSDIFSFGSTLYEMLAGEAPFKRRTPMESAHAIVQDWANALPDKVPDDLADVIARCLSKNPAERFQTAAELKAALRNLVVQSLADPVTELSPRKRWLHGWMHVARARWDRGKDTFTEEMGRLKRMPLRWTALVLATFAMLMAADLFVRVRSDRLRQPPTFQRLTFRQGPIIRARLANQGRDVAFTARFEGTPQTSYLLTAATGAVRELKLPPDSSVVAVSSKGDVAVRQADGSLARMGLKSGQIVNQATAVLDADFSPGGDAMAVAHVNPAGSAYLLEYPIGHVLVKSITPIDLVRVSPKGDRVAYSKIEGAQKRLWVANKSGDSKQLADLGAGDANRSLSWSSDGQEIWFGATNAQERGIIQAVNMDGERRTVDWMPEAQLDDVGANGEALVEMFRGWNGARIRGISEGRDADLSWFGESVNMSLSADGTRAFFTEHGSGVYTRLRNGSPPVRLGEGSLVAVSPDGKWASVYRSTPQPRYYLVPSDGSKEMAVDIPVLDGHTAAVIAWRSDGSYLVWGNLPGHNKQHFLWNPKGGKPRLVTPMGSSIGLASGDGKTLLVSGPNNAYYVFPVEGGQPVPARGLLPADQLLSWANDGKSIYVGALAPNRHDFSIFKLNPTTGARTLWKLVQPDVQADSLGPTAITPDGNIYAYLYFRAQSELFLARGLR
jgi:WD40 repeat protein